MKKWFGRSCCTSKEEADKQRQLSIGLVGNPNCGKTTLFNALTGACQRVGNWPGVTVERKSGFFSENDTYVEVVDLPGVYSLIAVSESASIDERIACETILHRDVDLIVNILDASNLERNLYLTLQLLEMGAPMIVAVNMMDIARQRGLELDVKRLQQALGCRVVLLEANKKIGIETLKQVATSYSFPNGASCQQSEIPWQSKALRQAIEGVEEACHLQQNFLALRLLEDDVVARKQASADVIAEVKKQQDLLHATLGEESDILLADARYRFIEQLLLTCLGTTASKTATWTARIDHIILNRFLGIPIFLAVMYGMFFFAVNIGGAFQDFFDMSSNTIFVDGLAYVLGQLALPPWIIAVLANGVGKGINTVLTFIPVIGAMFLFLAVLEDSGYMSRAAFVVDRLMRMMGLPGKSFVPMIVGFGCNVPGVMATRTLDNKRDRILTVMMSPFMSCSARLAIYAVFAAAFFPVGGQNIIFALYIIGIGMAMLTGLLLRKTTLRGEPSPLVMELPPYHFPQGKTLLLLAWQRLKGFLFRAGKLIVPICLLVGTLNAMNVDGSLNGSEAGTHSVLSLLGQWVTPIFAPMGIHQDNWPATVGLVTGVLAKEVVVGTLNSLYAQLGHVAQLQSSGFSFWGGLHAAVASIPANIAHLGQSLGNPILAKAPVHVVTQPVYGQMSARFDGKIGAFAYLLFVLLYFPCISTTAAMLREVSRAWTVFSVCWTTGLAYCVAVTFYQAATLWRHPLSSLLWVGAIATVMTFTVLSIRSYARGCEQGRGDYEFA